MRWVGGRAIYCGRACLRSNSGLRHRCCAVQIGKARCGEALAPADEDPMQLIGMLDSPYVRRVAVALIIAKVPFEHRPISLFRHIDAFSKINPLLKAPTLVAENGTVLMDSGVILDYLGRLSAGRRADALEAARPPARASCDGARAHRHGKSRAAPLRACLAACGQASRSLGREGHEPALGRTRRARRGNAAERLDRRRTWTRRRLRGLRLRLHPTGPSGRGGRQSLSKAR